MRTHIMTLTLAAVLALPVAVQAQSSMTTPSHHSREAVVRLLENRDQLQLTAVQVDSLTRLQERFTREQTRLVRVGWLGAPGKARVPRFAKILVPAQPDRYTEVNTASRRAGFSRVPGKMVPRVERIAVTRVIEMVCPFAFLTGNQMDRVHEILSSM